MESVPLYQNLVNYLLYVWERGENHEIRYDQMISDLTDRVADAFKRNGMPEEKLLKKDRLGPVLLILFLIAGGLSLFWAVRVRSHFPASVAVIGGADGPTSIFVAGYLGPAWGLYPPPVLFLLAQVAPSWTRRRTS